ncbi:hypothetical protein BJ912DRAFT_994983, partial [Pholiota molesta]
ALLAAAVALPPSPAVAYALFRPATPTTPHDAIELARRAILARNATPANVTTAASSNNDKSRSGNAILDAILPAVHIGLEPFLYAFKITAQHTAHAEAELLASLSLGGLAGVCISVCPPTTHSQRHHTLLPSHHDQTVLSYFYDAVRARIIDDIVIASTQPSVSSVKRHVKRFKNGFLMSQITPSSDWEYKAITGISPLFMRIHFSYTSEGTPSHLLVHPMLLPTSFLDISRSLPLPAGTPITLLPYGTPAYYLASYTGPTASLIKQFQASLQGMGRVSGKHPVKLISIPRGDSPSDGSPQTPTFIIGWIKVENKQGEDKGITIIYPTRLCLSYIPCSSSRPSPQGPGTFVASAYARANGALTLSKTNDLRQVASEVGGYVDAVARERERERERLKREREYGASTSPKMARTTATRRHLHDATASTPAAAALSSIATDVISELTSIPSQSPSASTVVPPHMHAAAGAPSSYDMYGMDSAGGSSAYLGLDMDMDMDFGMGDLGLSFGMGMGMGMGGMDGLGGMDGISAMDTTPSVGNAGRSSGVGGGGGGMSMEFEDAFTDDDFSFFDRPARPAAAPPAPPNFAVHSRTAMSPAGLISAADVRTPECAAGLGLGTLSAPATPGVHLSSGAAHAHPPHPVRAVPSPADGKYAVGKFAVGVGLPSPPASEEDALEFGMGGVRGPGSLPASPGMEASRSITISVSGQGWNGNGNGTGVGGWRLRYDAATDPRIGVVRQLIGVKRKPRLAQGARDPQRTAPWVSTGSSTGGAACEEWETPLFLDAPGSTAGAAADAASEAEATTTRRRRSSHARDAAAGVPPLGPTLLHTQFQHAALLPLSAPLRPPGASVLPAAELGMGVGAGMGLAPPPPLSVPTPVSPAATMGAASEKSKSLESAAHVVGVEVVENPVWAETWRAASAVGGAVRRRAEIWPGDCRAVEGLLGSVRGLQGGMSLAEVFGLDAEKGATQVQALDAPMITIGKGDAIIQVLPTALRFWEKLGLSPKGGRKDLSAFVLFEDEGEGREALVETWLWETLRNYGLGMSTVCAKDGLVPMRFDASFRKSLGMFTPTLVLFLVLPITVMSLSSPVLRQILSVIKKVLSNYRASQVFFQFIPEQHLFSSLEKTSGYDSALDRLVFSIYDRIQVPVTYVRAAHTSLDVLDRHTLLHVAYHLTACGKWIIAACVDQRGEAYETGVWLTQEPVERERDAHEGAEGEVSKETWTEYLQANVVPSREQPPLHHTLVCVVPDASCCSAPGPPSRSASSSKQTYVYTDVSSITYAVFPTTRIPISVPPTQSDLGLAQSLIHEPATPASFSHHLPPHTSLLIRVPHPASPSSSSTTTTAVHLLRTFHSHSYTHSLQASTPSAAQVSADGVLLDELTRNYYELAVLARARWRLDGVGGHQGLPFHLAAVDAVRMALDRDWERLDAAVEV